MLFCAVAVAVEAVLADAGQPAAAGLERCRAPNNLYAQALKLHSEYPEADRGCYFRAVALAAEAVLADAGEPAAAGAGALPGLPDRVLLRRVPGD